VEINKLKFRLRGGQKTATPFSLSEVNTNYRPTLR